MNAARILKGASFCLSFFYKKLWKLAAAFVLAWLYPSHMAGLKRFIIRRFVAHLGNEVLVSPGFFVFDGDNLRFGDQCHIGYWFKVFDFASVSVGAKLLASHNITLIAGTHLQDDNRSYLPGPILIGSNVWIGANVLIVGPCDIGNDSIIGANSFVTGKFPERSVIAGSPAKVLRKT